MAILNKIFLAAVLLAALGGYPLAIAWGGEQMDNSAGSGDRVERAAETRQKWLGDAQNPLAKSDPDLAAISDRLIYGEIHNFGSLSERQAALLLLAALAASQGWEAFSEHVEAALRLGASGAEIRETLYQCAPYIGLPRVQKALSLANPVFEKAGIPLPTESAATVTEDTRLEEGLAVQRRIFGAEHIDRMRENAPAMQKPLLANYLSAWCFGDFYTRKVLDLKMRELVTFCAIVALGGCDPQAGAHASANLAVGNSPENLVDALANMLPWIGFPRTLNGLAQVNAAIAKSVK